MAFGNNGVAENGDACSLLVVQPDDEILVSCDSTIRRLNADGTRDETFGAFSVPPGLQSVQPDGKILTASGASIVSRRNPDGSADDTFGVGGTAQVILSRLTGATTALALQPDGRLLVAVLVPLSGAALLRYDENGVLDSSFAIDGILSLPMLPIGARALVVQSDGRIAVLGGAGSWILLRYNADGSVDTAFGSDGSVNTSLAGGKPRDLLLQADGRLLAAGDAWQPGTTSDLALARYDTAFCGSGVREGVEQCDDGNTDANDGCDARCEVECTSAPRAGCNEPSGWLRSLLKIRSTKTNRISWRWSTDQTNPGVSLESPSAEEYAFCIYDGAQLASSTMVPSETTCFDRPCWHATDRGSAFRDSRAQPDGVARLLVSNRRVGLRARGPDLDLFDVSFLTQPLTVQLVSQRTETCWQATYTPPFAYNGMQLIGRSE